MKDPVENADLHKGPMKGWGTLTKGPRNALTLPHTFQKGRNLTQALQRTGALSHCEERGGDWDARWVCESWGSSVWGLRGMLVRVDGS